MYVIIYYNLDEVVRMDTIAAVMPGKEAGEEGHSSAMPAVVACWQRRGDVSCGLKPCHDLVGGTSSVTSHFPVVARSQPCFSVSAKSRCFWLTAQMARVASGGHWSDPPGQMLYC